MLPVEQQLVFDEFGAGCVDDLRPESLVLQQLQQIQTLGILDERGILLVRPVEKVFQVVDKVGMFEVASLRQKVQVVWVGQALNEFQLDLEPSARLFLGLRKAGHSTMGGCRD